MTKEQRFPQPPIRRMEFGPRVEVVSMMDAPIGVFDSGVGGLSVLREIRALLPAEDLLYVADSGAAPYGDRPEEFIRERVWAIAEFLVQMGVKMIVVACNTATAVGVELLRSRLSIPVVAMEPAVKPAASLSRSKIIGVLATSRTLASERFARLAENFGRGVQIILQPCPGFVEQVERGDIDSPETVELVKKHVLPLIEKGADTLVLGCTHYPFLLPVIREVAGPGVSVVDASLPVARHVANVLQARGLLSSRQVPGTERFWTSGEPSVVSPVISKLWGRAVHVEALPAKYSVPRNAIQVTDASPTISPPH